jgi:K+-sensing histidine kinase KdpD
VGDKRKGVGVYAALVFRLSPKAPSASLGILAALVVVAIGAGVTSALESIAEPASLGIVFIPGVLLIATVWGLRLGLATAVLSALVFNFFYLPPLRELTINTQHDIVALVVFVIVAVAGGTLAELARARAAESERRREEADRALEEAAALAAERDRMREEALEAEAVRRSDELKTSLLRAVSHDLRTPLTAIIAAGAALDSPSVTAEERHELSDAVVDEGRRLSRLVENLLDVSRLESGAAEPHREPIDLVDLLAAARESIGNYGEQVRLALDDDLPPLRADPTQLERAFANLLENAVVHGEGQPVLVRSRLVGPRLVVRVVDRGPGIPENLRERIFEPFYRAPGAASGAGSGLGLAIARGFIEANGGEVEVESLPGQGSSFVVTFAVPTADPPSSAVPYAGIPVIRNSGKGDTP